MASILVSGDTSGAITIAAPAVAGSGINDYLLSGWTKGTSKKHLTEEYRNKLKQHAIKQWQEVKASGYTNKSKNNRIQSCL
jgi:hypothetical protein